MSSVLEIVEDDEGQSPTKRQKLNLQNCRTCREYRKKVRIPLAEACVGLLADSRSVTLTVAPGHRSAIIASISVLMPTNHLETQH